MVKPLAESAATAPSGPVGGSIDAADVARFSAMADAWWDPTGKFKPLHRFNPIRIGFIRDRVARHFGRDPAAARPLDGLRLLDVGCGGGLLSEPMARLGAIVTGIDASTKNIEIARLHAGRSELTIDYRAAAPEQLAGEHFDVVLNMEVVEHVADVDGFLAACGHLVDPAGLMFVATLNRTVKSLLMAKIGAEYVLRWLPAGTHDWSRFLRCSTASLRAASMEVDEMAGMTYSLLSDSWSLSRDLDMNYLLVARRTAGH